MKASRRWAKWLIAIACVVSLVVLPASAGAAGPQKLWDDPRYLMGEPDVPNAGLLPLGIGRVLLDVWVVRTVGWLPQQQGVMRGQAVQRTPVEELRQ